MTDADLAGVEITQENLVRPDDPANNMTDLIYDRIGRELHRRPNHPLGIIKGIIQEHFEETQPGFNFFDDLPPVVTHQMNFDEVLVPADHVSRSYNDTHYPVFHQMEGVRVFDP